MDQVWTEVALDWDRVIASRAPGAASWAMLRMRISEHLHAADREMALSEVAAFRRATRRFLDSYRSRLAGLESDLGLYGAISRLQDEHYDVIVLQYILEYPPRKVASIMGIEQPTVRYHRRGARARLAADLGIDLTAPDDPNGEDEQ